MVPDCERSALKEPQAFYMAIENLQVTASKVLRENRGFLVLLGLFPIIEGVRLRDGTLMPYTNWTLVLSGAMLLPGLYFLIRLIVAVLQNAADARREQDGNMIFQGAIGWQLLLFVSVVLFIGLDVGIYRQDGRVRAVDIAFTVVMCVLAFYCWPRTIEFSGDALLQKSLFGGVRFILFSDVISAKFNRRQQCIIVSGRNGARVVHSMFHAGRIQFAHQLTRLTGTHVAGLTA